ncbi:molybdopterin adenylyltransferase [Candidatus Oleimmundimicrobium sp.]|uniref:molybdopterin adenylyltransferase n=1 Tax=Candidatus Oleimmundimicrobium sp. TaxID=3060597 RepID=UPI0027244D51|nr:molybdopterin adenylyltransferase [Candidatus Oleimmundimicrobium sp.]MDO8886883.1 molybdopterin adenylyltransferase [Candidatus Oleimmundimicrobium sp.]
MKVAILTISDKGSKGERVDESGKILQEIMEKNGAEIVSYQIIPDEKRLIAKDLRILADYEKVDLVLTTGGTGLSPRDVTPEATISVIDKEVPGFAEAMRAESLKITPNAMLSRAVSGMRGRTLIINLPGSPKAAKECLEVVLPAIPHGIKILRGEGGECAVK